MGHLHSVFLWALQKTSIRYTGKQKIVFLRFGEFHKMENGKITETYVYLGLAELIIAMSLWPLSASNGYERIVPGPATHDGVLIEEPNASTSRASAD